MPSLTARTLDPPCLRDADHRCIAPAARDEAHAVRRSPYHVAQVAHPGHGARGRGDGRGRDPEDAAGHSSIRGCRLHPKHLAGPYAPGFAGRYLHFDLEPVRVDESQHRVYRHTIHEVARVVPSPHHDAPEGRTYHAPCFELGGRLVTGERLGQHGLGIGVFSLRGLDFLLGADPAVEPAVHAGEDARGEGHPRPSLFHLALSRGHIGSQCRDVELDQHGPARHVLPFAERHPCHARHDWSGHEDLTAWSGHNHCGGSHQRLYTSGPNLRHRDGGAGCRGHGVGRGRRLTPDCQAASQHTQPHPPHRTTPVPRSTSAMASCKARAVSSVRSCTSRAVCSVCSNVVRSIRRAW